MLLFPFMMTQCSFHAKSESSCGETNNRAFHLSTDYSFLDYPISPDLFFGLTLIEDDVGMSIYDGWYAGLI